MNTQSRKRKTISSALFVAAMLTFLYAAVLQSIPAPTGISACLSVNRNTHTPHTHDQLIHTHIASVSVQEQECIEETDEEEVDRTNLRRRPASMLESTHASVAILPKTIFSARQTQRSQLNTVLRL